MTDSDHPRSTPDARFGWLRAGLATLALALFAGPVLAQSTIALERLAPADSIVALGLTPGGLPDGDLADAFESLDTEAANAALERLGEVFDELDGAGPMGMGVLSFLLDEFAGMPSSMDPGIMVDEGLVELEERCPGLGEVTTTLFEQAWAGDLLLAIAWDPFSSIPGGLALARVDEAATPAATALHAQLVECFAGEPLGSAEGVTLDLIGDGSDLPVVVAMTGDLFIVGTQPELVRGALARHAGSEATSLADRPGAFLEHDVGARLYYDLGGLAELVATVTPVPQNDPALTAAVERGLSVFRTVGEGSARIALTDEGIEATTRAFPNPDGGDAELYDLLTCAGCEAPDASWAAGDAVSVRGTSFDLDGWVDWLDGLASELTEATMGAPMTLSGTLLDQFGVDLDLLLLDWIGDRAVTSQLATVSTDLRDLVEMPAISIIEVQSNAAAEAGLEAIEAAYADLVTAVEASDGDLQDLQNVVGQIAIRRGETMGVPFRRVQISATTDLRIAVGFDRLVIATSEEAFETALALVEGSGPNGSDSEGWAAVQAASSGNVSAWRYGDGGAPLQGIADLLELAAQPAAAGLAAAAQAALDEADEMDFADEATFPEESDEPIDLASAMGYTGPDGITEADAAELAFGTPVEATYGPDTPTFDFDAIDVWRLPTVEPGTEVSVVMTSTPLDTYLYLYDAATGEVLAENDDAPWTDRSEIRFVSDGRDLLVGASSWSGSGEGPYVLEATSSAPTPVAEPEPEPEPEEVEPEVEAPSFAELLPLTEIVAEAVSIVADRLGVSWSVTSSDDSAVTTHGLQQVTW